MLFDKNVTCFLIASAYLAAFFITIFKINHQAERTKFKLSFQAKYHGYLIIAFAAIISIAGEVIFFYINSNFFGLESLLINSILLLILAIIIIKPSFNAKRYVESLNKVIFTFMCRMTIALTLVLVLVILFNAWPFFKEIPLHKYLLGTYWNPQTAELAGYRQNSFGLLPVLSGTLLVAFISIIIALPIGLLSAIYLAEFAGSKFKATAKSTIELLAGVPTVVYGYFAAIIVGPKIRQLGEMLGLEMGSESALAAGVVMGIMIMPYITSLSEDVLTSVPRTIRDGAIALGLTRSETVVGLVLPIAAPGILAATLLAISRAIGETMIVAMAAGLSAKMTVNPFDSVTTITVQIVRLLSGDQEYGSITTSSAFALALTLFLMTLLLNSFASAMINKYRKKYE